MARAGKDLKPSSYFDRLESDLKSNQSTLSLVLGALIILVAGVLLFNYFNRGSSDIGPAQQTTEKQEDVSPEGLPGNYTVKEGDTLFLIAENYYKDGYKFSEIVKANDLANADVIEVGQVLKIPKLEGVEMAQASPTEQASPAPAASAQALASPSPSAKEEAPAVGGADTTIWGPKIEGDTYTVTEGDWLSTISARAYGDIMAYPKIAQANNIANPDIIVPGQVLKLPR